MGFSWRHRVYFTASAKTLRKFVMNFDLDQDERGRTGIGLFHF